MSTNSIALIQAIILNTPPLTMVDEEDLIYTYLGPYDGSVSDWDIWDQIHQLLS